MSYTVENYRSKKALREATAPCTICRPHQDCPHRALVAVFQPGPFGPDVRDGRTTLEGPHFPEPHRWYASATIRDGFVVPGSVK